MNKEDLLALILPGRILFDLLKFFLKTVFFLEGAYLDSRRKKETFSI